LGQKLSAEIDYGAQGAFLFATNDFIQPAPIEKLLDLRPTFERWTDCLRNDLARGFPPEFKELGLFASCRLACIDEPYEGISAVSPITKEASAELNVGIRAWMDRFCFRKPWIGDAGLLTLFHHAFRGAPAGRWYFFPPPDKISPQVTIAFRPTGSKVSELKKEFDQHIQELRMQYLKTVKFRWGARADNGAPAKFAALRFAGYQWPEIAGQHWPDADSNEKEKSRADNVRKDANNFAKRANLGPFPTPAERAAMRRFTLAETLAAKGKEPSKTRHKQLVSL
jgi:hypothetical protein